MKICYECKQKKQYSEFHKDSTKRDGYYSLCKDCRRKRSGAKKHIPSPIIGVYKDKYIVAGEPYPYIKGTRIRAHRYIKEQEIGRKLLIYEHVHHVDGNNKNFDTKNLIILNKIVHHKLHPTPKCNDGIWQTCITCSKKNWIIPWFIEKRFGGNRKRAQWYWCNQCANRKGGRYPKSIQEKIFKLSS